MFYALGGMLLVYAATPQFERAGGIMAIVLNGLWVLGSAAILLTGLPFTTIGMWIVIGVADVVGLFGLVQWVGLRRNR